MDELEEQLHYATHIGDVDQVKQLLSNPQINLNCQDENDGDVTPLFSACLEDHVEVVKLLLNDERVDVNLANESGITPFCIACERGNDEIVKLLLENEKVEINEADNDDWTPFHYVCYSGRIDVAKILLNDRRVEINKENVDRHLPFWIACSERQFEIVEHILASGREGNFNQKDEKGISALDVVKEREKEERRFWENEKLFQERQIMCANMIELLESFEKNPEDTRTRLRIKLGCAGK